MNKKQKAKKIAYEMLSKDTFSQFLGIEILEIGLGYCTIKMQVKNDMLNGFKVAHGGITFSLADSAFAFASNSQGQHAVSIHTDINHMKPVFEGDELTAQAVENYIGKSTGIYTVEVKNQNEVLVALFKGTVFRKQNLWFAEESN